MALQFNYGIRNYCLHTVSHCDCDARFWQCLLAINDTVSNIIGVTFLNLLEVPCFVLEESEECGTGGVGPGMVCRCYRHLDKCEHQIAPHKVRYQLHNMKSQTLLHCNCTHRLAWRLHRVKNCSDMEVAALADYINTDCFVLENLLPAAQAGGHSTAAQKDPEALAPSSCELQGQASRLEDTSQQRHPL